MRVAAGLSSLAPGKRGEQQDASDPQPAARRQNSENREPQNIEYGIMNVEGKENFIIRNTLFDIRFSKQGSQIIVGSNHSKGPLP